MSIVHIEHRSHWTGIANAMLEDHRLSFKARGLLAYLLTKPEGWETQTTQLSHASDHDGRSAIYSALEELTTYGYATYEQPRQAGRFIKGGWTIRETPQTGFPLTENPDTEKSPTENRHLSKDLKKVKTEESKTQREFPLCSSPNGKTARPTKRPPADFTITESLKAWAGENVPGVNLTHETAIFMDYEFAHGKTDWPATWRNWMRKAVERLPHTSQKSLPLQRERLPL